MNNKVAILLPMMGLLLTSCANAKVPSDMNFSLLMLGNNVEIHTELQNRYIESTNYESTLYIAAGSAELSQPQGVVATYEAKPVNGRKCSDYVIKVVEKENSEEEFTFYSDKEMVTFTNLKVNTEYEYHVIARYDDVTFTSEPSYFKTVNRTPRNLNIPNVMNARDLGGNNIKQGLIYRSGRFNESDGTTKITDETLNVTREQLKIKTEIDLRRPDENGGITSSVLGEDVNYVHLPMYYGGNNILTHVGDHSDVHYDNPAQIKIFFETLADENNYPINFHCAIGKDRTGCMAYLIEALCGENIEYLYRDYLFSNFAKISGMCVVTDISSRYGETISSYTGEDLQEKTYKYLSEKVGVSTDDLDSVISILTTVQ